eukprot:TRINITY_DN3137_c0_g1_i1.p1 TRINITY_DN3137_c0_g1~~TRINITY_DN3137_c0_g1_i1.p1  ORF type:complete len:278 (+),score=83.07 TRINITY_DN3137_c0_g1_i1:123-956(+)
MCIRDRYQRRVRGVKSAAMGCAISEEDDQSEYRDPAVVDKVTISGESGFKKTVKARKLLFMGMDDHGRNAVVCQVVQRHGNGAKADPMGFGPPSNKNMYQVSVDALPRLDLNRHKNGDEILPVNCYELDFTTAQDRGSHPALLTFSGGPVHAVVVVLDASWVKILESGEMGLTPEDEATYIGCLEKLGQSNIIGRVPVMVLLNNIQTLRNPDCVCHGEWEERKHKIELDVKLSLIDIEEQVSDLIVFGLEQPLEENQDFNPTAIEWLVRKIRKVAVD